jgi:hypothetical protein
LFCARYVRQTHNNRSFVQSYCAVPAGRLSHPCRRNAYDEIAEPQRTAYCSLAPLALKRSVITRLRPKLAGDTARRPRQPRGAWAPASFCGERRCSSFYGEGPRFCALVETDSDLGFGAVALVGNRQAAPDRRRSGLSKVALRRAAWPKPSARNTKNRQHAADFHLHQATTPVRSSLANASEPRFRVRAIATVFPCLSIH